MNGSIKIFLLIIILIPAAMGCSSSADSSTALSGAAKISRAVITPSLAEIPDLYSRFTAVGLEASIKTKRDLFRFESPETDAVEGGENTIPAAAPPPPAPAPGQMSGEAEGKCNPSLRFLGYFGYPDQRIGVFAREGSWEPILACEGDFMEIGFRLARMGYGSATLTAGCLDTPRLLPLAGGIQ